MAITLWCLLKMSMHAYTSWQKEPYPGGACLSENQWSVCWGHLSVVMKLRGHSSTQTTNPTWPQLTRPWQCRQLEQREQSQSIWVTTNTPKQTHLCFIFYFMLSQPHSISPASSLFFASLSGSNFSIQCLLVRKCLIFHLKSPAHF